MEAIVTSDWQASWSNLDKCEIALQELITQCKQNDISLVVHAGDFKHHYSPVDVRVINFGVRFVRELRSSGIKVIILLGNHDRVSMSSKSDNWFPALKAAGAITVDTPTFLDEFDIAAVPYMASADEAKAAFRKLSRKAKSTSTLLFHNEISGCKINVDSTSKDDSIKLQDLRPNSYALCLGGHIHLRQKVKGNCYYVGSPFAQDWGEANQRKGNTLVRGSNIQFLETAIPGVYDPSLPGFDKASPKSWVGAKVRVHAVFDKSASMAYQPFINKASERAAKQYPGADITVVPEFLDEADSTEAIVSGSDASIIASYVSKTHSGSTADKAKIATYLSEKLKLYGSWSSDSRTIEFLSAEAENFLCFERVKLTFKKGITVVTGVNKDWLGRNNGSGKTSLMQIPVTALTGVTLKDQKAQALVRRNSEKKSKSYVSLKFKSADNKVCEVFRSRRPRKLEFSIDGKDQTVGIGNRGTQDQIQRVSGLSLESIRNSMYIDQGAVSAVLLGSDTERKNIFAKFLGLERYELARKDCVESLSKIKKKILDAEEDIRTIKAAIKVTQENIRDFAPGDSVKTLRVKLRKQVKQLAKCKAAVVVKGFQALLDKQVAKEQKLYDEATSYAKSIHANRALISNHRSSIEQLQQYQKLKTCPVCLQSVNDKMLTSELARLKDICGKLVDDNVRMAAKELAVRASMDTVRDAIEDMRSEHTVRERKVVEVEYYLARTKEALTKANTQHEIKRKYLARLAKKKVDLESVVKYAVALNEAAAVEQYCVKALSRDGVPSFVVANTVPKLNAASKKYAKLFSDNEIRVRFRAEAGDIDVEVLNLHGGASVKDQSAGETRIAGIITSFSVRDVINPSNLLVLDEPGESLDEMNAKVFAEGLREASKTLGCIMITTHNPFILGELRGERLIEVVKRNGVSSIVNVQ